MNYLISKGDVQLLLNYLGSKPYIEVSKLISIIAQLKSLPADSKDKNESAKKPQ